MEKKTFTVAMIGISEAERNVLRNIFKLSQYRPSSYTFAVPGEVTNILMVDADDPQAMANWRGKKEGATSSGSVDTYRSNIPTILVTREAPKDSILYYLRRPFVANRVISIFDQVVEKELRAGKERIIGDSIPLTVAEPETRRVVAAPTAPTAPVTPAAVVVEDEKTYTALVVDDSAPVRRQLELELKLFGIRADTAIDGEQAIELLNRTTYNLIFLDVVLPGIDGYQLCKAIKKNKAKKKTPVIMLTSKSSPFDRVRGLLVGCDTYLTKPVKQDTFQKVVKKYLQ